MSGTIAPCFITHPNRGLITVSGQDAFKFLQNLITNDLEKLEDDKLLYSCLLTAQGKFLHDFFVSKTDDAYLLDCEGGDRAKNLAKRLTIYKLRANVKIETQEQISIYMVLPATGQFDDPRNTALGSRSFEKPDLPEQPFSVWDEIRIRHSISDGSRDAEIEKSTLEEVNMAENAVAYDKGCYVGQELTARMHFRGLAKKRLYPVRLPLNSPDAELRSNCNDIGLALIKNEIAEKAAKTSDGIILL